MNKNIRLSGNAVFSLNFGLYGLEDIDFFKSKDSILNAFKEEFEQKIKDRLNKVGIKLIGFEYFSPHAYNYETDSVDITIRIINKELLKASVLKHKKEIQNLLDKNCSYDGYIATTPNSVNDVIENINKNDLDVITLNVLLNDIDFKDFEICNYLIFDDNEDIFYKGEIKC